VSQTDQVLALLRRRGDAGITALDALDEVGSFRLAARIADLHELGFSISSEMETRPNGKRIARYRLVEHRPIAGTQLEAFR
jgi:hypothetical protein